MNLYVTRRAARSVNAIAGYIRQSNPRAAQDVEQAIRDVFDLIAAHPQIGRSQPLGLRRLPVPRLPYNVFYRVRAVHNRVEIIAVNHAARKRQP